MPNTPCLVGEVASAMCLGGRASEEDGKVVKTLFSAVGFCCVVEEKLLSAVTGLSGSGPAYVFVMIEALADGGVKAGLPRDIAQQLAAQTVFGSAKMVLQTGKHPGQLKDMVTSPAGLCLAGSGLLLLYTTLPIIFGRHSAGRPELSLRTILLQAPPLLECMNWRRLVYVLPS